MHGRDLEKQRCLSSNTGDDNHGPRWPNALLPARQRGQEPGASGEGTGVSEGGHQVWGHPPGTGSPRWWWLLPSPPQPVLGTLPTMQPPYYLLHSLLPHPSYFWGYFHPCFAGLPFLLFPPSSPFSPPKACLRHACVEKKIPPASCQRCLWPLAPVSCLTLIPQFIQRSPGPNPMSQEPARNLSFS